MYEINVTEFRNHLPKYLSSAQKGQEILITSHGHVIARILPPLDTKADAKRQLKELRKKSKILDVTSPIDATWNVEK